MSTTRGCSPAARVVVSGIMFTLSSVVLGLSIYCLNVFNNSSKLSAGTTVPIGITISSLTATYALYTFTLDRIWGVPVWLETLITGTKWGLWFGNLIVFATFGQPIDCVPYHFGEGNDPDSPCKLFPAIFPIIMVLSGLSMLVHFAWFFILVRAAFHKGREGEPSVWAMPVSEYLGMRGMWTQSRTPRDYMYTAPARTGGRFEEA